MNLFRKLSRILSRDRGDAEVGQADDNKPDVEQSTGKLSQTAANRNPAAPELVDDYEPTVPNLTIIDEASLAPVESEGFDPYDTIAGTSRTDLLKDD